MAELKAAPEWNPLKMGTSTKYGIVKAISFREGERYYMLINQSGTVSLMPADAVESAVLYG